MAKRFEHCRMYWDHGEEAERYVTFSNGEEWKPLAADAFWSTIRRLEDGGWELVTVSFPASDPGESVARHYYFYFKRPVEVA